MIYKSKLKGHQDLLHGKGEKRVRVSYNRKGDTFIKKRKSLEMRFHQACLTCRLDVDN